jgi:hypothetical protein
MPLAGVAPQPTTPVVENYFRTFDIASGVNPAAPATLLNVDLDFLTPEQEMGILSAFNRILPELNLAVENISAELPDSFSAAAGSFADFVEKHTETLGTVGWREWTMESTTANYLQTVKENRAVMGLHDFNHITCTPEELKKKKEERGRKLTKLATELLKVSESQLEELDQLLSQGQDERILQLEMELLEGYPEALNSVRGAWLNLQDVRFDRIEAASAASSIGVLGVAQVENARRDLLRDKLRFQRIIDVGGSEWCGDDVGATHSDVLGRMGMNTNVLMKAVLGETSVDLRSPIDLDNPVFRSVAAEKFVGYALHEYGHRIIGSAQRTALEEEISFSDIRGIYDRAKRASRSVLNGTIYGDENCSYALMNPSEFFCETFRILHLSPPERIADFEDEFDAMGLPGDFQKLKQFFDVS